MYCIPLSSVWPHDSLTQPGQHLSVFTRKFSVKEAYFASYKVCVGFCPNFPSILSCPLYKLLQGLINIFHWEPCEAGPVSLSLSLLSSQRRDSLPINLSLFVQQISSYWCQSSGLLAWHILPTRSLITVWPDKTPGMKDWLTRAGQGWQMRGTIHCNLTQIVPTASAPFIVQSSIIFSQIFFSPWKMFINCIPTILWELSGQTTGRVGGSEHNLFQDWHSER